MESTEIKLNSVQQQRLSRFNAEGSVDIHCHCLPGVDDGPPTMEDALMMCKALVNDGFTAVIATPHQLGRYDGRNDAKSIRNEVTALREVLTRENVALRVEAGADVRVDERLIRLLDSDEVLTLGDRHQAILLELPHDAFLDLAPLLRQLAERGITAVLSHPERHQYLSKRPELALPWIQHGIVFQVTAGSFLGDFGRDVELAVWDWLRKGLVSLVATDSHDLKRRRPRMSAAIELIARQMTHVVARRICIENPLRILRGERLPPPAAATIKGR